MVAYEFPSRVAKDPTLDTLVKDGVGFIYALNDTSHTAPLAITDRFGLPKPNVRTTYDGVTEEFFCEDNSIVWWVSGPYAFLIVSFTGLKAAAEAAMAAAGDSAAAALAAQLAAEAALASASGLSDTAMRDLINTTTSLTRLALDAVVPVIAAKVTTADLYEPKKIIALSDGTVKAIPRDAAVPAAPSGLTVTSGATMVRLRWDAVPNAAYYQVFRNNVPLAAAASGRFLDNTGLANTEYSYSVATYDNYGQRSVVSAPAFGTFNPALNVAPIVEVRTWPTTIPTSGTVVVRVTSRDADAQNLAMALGVDSGSIRPTTDPSVWLYTI
ncbi:MAG TPA: hypothetical protein VJ617_19915 [Arthrobacter sp.]|nr:hypothetical protein [Arthrobacter sp.]